MSEQTQRLGKFTKDDVIRALATPLAPTAVDFEVVDVWQTSPTGLRVLARVDDHRRSLTQTWMVTLPIDAEEWERLDHWETLHTIYRAQLEDWWATHEREATSNTMGIRLDGPQSNRTS